MDKNTYIYRINQVIDYVRSHLDEELSLQTLASLATFSPFHFHRIFKALTGETVNDFVRRVRLETFDNLDLTATDKCRYDAGFTVPDTVTSGSGEVGVQDVPAGRYAVCRVAVENPNGDHVMGEAIARLGEAVDYLYGAWLPDSGYELEDRPCLELYQTPPDASTVVIDFCLPVRAA